LSDCVYGFWLAKHNLFLARRFGHCLIDRHLLAWLYSSMTHIRPLFDLEMTSDPFPFRFTQLIDNLEFCKNGNSILISIHDSRSRSKNHLVSCWARFRAVSNRARSCSTFKAYFSSEIDSKSAGLGLIEFQVEIHLVTNPFILLNWLELVRTGFWRWEIF